MRILGFCAALLGAARAFQPPRPAASLKSSLRASSDDSDLPEVAPGEIDWDNEFKRLKRGEIDTTTAKRNEVVARLPRPTAPPPAPPSRRDGLPPRSSTSSARAASRGKMSGRRLRTCRTARAARRGTCPRCPPSRATPSSGSPSSPPSRSSPSSSRRSPDRPTSRRRTSSRARARARVAGTPEKNPHPRLSYIAPLCWGGGLCRRRPTSCGRRRSRPRGGRRRGRGRRRRGRRRLRAGRSFRPRWRPGRRRSTSS